MNKTMTPQDEIIALRRLICRIMNAQNSDGGVSNDWIDEQLLLQEETSDVSRIQPPSMDLIKTARRVGRE